MVGDKDLFISGRQILQPIDIFHSGRSLYGSFLQSYPGSALQFVCKKTNYLKILFKQIVESMSNAADYNFGFFAKTFPMRVGEFFITSKFNSDSLLFDFRKYGVVAECLLILVAGSSTPNVLCFLEGTLCDLHQGEVFLSKYLLSGKNLDGCMFFINSIGSFTHPKHFRKTGWDRFSLISIPQFSSQFSFQNVPELFHNPISNCDFLTTRAGTKGMFSYHVFFPAPNFLQALRVIISQAKFCLWRGVSWMLTSFHRSPR